MTTSSWGVALVTGLLGGIILGVVFFAALYVTARRAPFSLRPGMWFSLSFAMRFGVLATALYLAAQQGIATLLGCSAGILLGRYGFQRVVLTRNE